MRPMFLTLVLGAILTGAAIAQPSPAASPSPGPSPALVVHIANFAFAPDPAAIRAGETVQFINDDEVPHTVTAADRSFSSGNLPHGASWSHTFPTAGTVAYICAYHPFMHGRVIVSAR
jgi:plastocyanin